MQRVMLNVAAHEGSRFVQMLREITPALLTVQGRSGTHSRLWRRMVRGTLIEPLPLEPPSTGSHAAHEGSDPHLQCNLEDQNGQPLLVPFTCVEHWERFPYFVTIRLVAQIGGADRRCLGEARVGTRGPYARLLDKLAQTAILLVKRALTDPYKENCRLDYEPIHRSTIDPIRWALGVMRRSRARLREQLLTWTWGIGVPLQLDLRVAVQTGHIGPIEWVVHGDRDCFFADPFICPGEDRYFLCERFVYARNCADIVSLTVDDPAGFRRIELPGTAHLSYPYLWREGSDIFLMPESGASCRTIIYKLTSGRAPEPIATVAEDRNIADATLFRVDSRYWIAYTDCAIGLDDNLCLMYADDLRGPWIEHAANPVKLDVCSSRSAGTPFQIDGKWYRPAQDCAAGYGSAIAINEVEHLDELCYREKTVAYIRPEPEGPYPDGLHTLSIQGDRALVDGKRLVVNWDVLFRKLWRRIRRTGLNDRGLHS